MKPGDTSSLSKVQKTVADLLGIPTQYVGCDVPIREIRGWDHILHLTLLFTIQDMVDRNLTVEQVGGAVTVRDFAELLESRNK